MRTRASRYSAASSMLPWSLLGAGNPTPVVNLEILPSPAQQDISPRTCSCRCLSWKFGSSSGAELTFSAVCCRLPSISWTQWLAWAFMGPHKAACGVAPSQRTFASGTGKRHAQKTRKVSCRKLRHCQQCIFKPSRPDGFSRALHCRRCRESPKHDTQHICSDCHTAMPIHSNLPYCWLHKSFNHSCNKDS